MQGSAGATRPRQEVGTEMDEVARPARTGPAGAEPAGDDQAVEDRAAADRANGDALAAAGADAPGTGDQRVDAALRLLEQVAELPVGEHAPVFERVHAELTEVLGDLDPDSAGTSG